jgi:hypothetical protein
MIYQLQSDFASNRFAGLAFTLILCLGAACWYQALSVQEELNSRAAAPAEHQMSVLPDPFEKS